MGRHSKSNNARAHFSNAELEMVKDRWGSRKSRVGGESMRQFNSCSLCLAAARDPVACKQGHLFCKECVLTDLVSQKVEIARQASELERMERQEEQERIQSRQQARERVIKDFEITSGAANRIGGGKGKEKEEGESSLGSNGVQTSSKSSSISLSDLPSRALELANQAEEAALKTIEAEQREARKAKLPAFWLPSLTPSQKEGNVSISDLKKSLTTRCKISEHGHPMTSKNLIDVKFTLAASSGSTNQDSNSNGPQTICPSCKKGLSNSSTLIILSRCGHVVCASCCNTLVKPSKSCVECDTPIKKIDKDLVTLAREGTGYSAGGNAETKSKGTAFQG